MKTFLYIISICIVITFLSIVAFAQDNNSLTIIKDHQEGPEGAVYYQTMRYCGNSIKLACTNTRTAIRCQRYYCIYIY